VAAAADENPSGVEVRPGADPVEERSDVLVRALAQESVVELKEGLPVTRRAPDVRHENGHPELVDDVVPRAQKVRTRLPLGTSVDLDRHGALARELRGVGLVEEARNLTPIEALPGHQLRLGPVGRVEPAELALRPALDLPRLDVVRIRVRARAGRF